MQTAQYQSKNCSTHSPDVHSKIILLLNASPRAAGHSQVLLDACRQGLLSAPDNEALQISLAGKRILPCLGCYESCREQGTCWIADDFEEVVNAWLLADAVILGSPVYTFGPPSQLYAFFDRLKILHLTNPARFRPGGCLKPLGIIVQGGSEYGGVEIAARELLRLTQHAGCFPVSGDMPGCSQGVIGQVRDGEEPSSRLLQSSSRLAIRVLEIANILRAGNEPDHQTLRLLIVRSGKTCTVGETSPPTYQLLDQILPDLGLPVNTSFFDLSSQSFAPCLACTHFCAADLDCIYKDGLQEFQKAWLPADIVLWPIDSLAQHDLASLHAAFDRLNQVRFETHFALKLSHMPRYLKVAGIIDTGVGSDCSALIIQFLQHTGLLYQNILIPTQLLLTPMPWNLPNDPYLEIIHKYLRTVFDVTIRVRSGLARLSDRLPAEYFPSPDRFGQIDSHHQSLAPCDE